MTLVLYKEVLFCLLGHERQRALGGIRETHDIRDPWNIRNPCRSSKVRWLFVCQINYMKIFGSWIICAQLIPAFFTKDCQLFHLLDSVWPFPGLLCEPGCEQRCIQHGAAAAGNSGTELLGSSLPGLTVLTGDLAWLCLSDARCVGDSLIRWFHHSPSPWPLPDIFLHSLLS